MMIRRQLTFFLLTKQQQLFRSTSRSAANTLRCPVSTTPTAAASLGVLQRRLAPITQRCYYSTSRVVVAAADDSSENAAIDNISLSSLESWVYTLPRLYVGPRPTSSLLQQPEPLQFSPSQRLNKHAMIRLSTDQVHYAMRVMRIQPITSFLNDASSESLSAEQKQQFRDSGLRLFNGRDGEWLAQLVNLQGSDDDNVDDGNSTTQRRRTSRSKRTVEDAFIVARCQRLLRPQSTSDEIPPPSSSQVPSSSTTPTPTPVSTAPTPSSNNICSPSIWLYMSPLSKIRSKWLVEKMTELNVAGLVWISSDHTEPSVWRASSNNLDLDKLVSILVEAAEQCERLTLPQLTILLSSTLSATSTTIPLPMTAVNFLKHWCKTEQEDASDSPFALPPNRILLVGRERQEQQVPHLISVLQQYYSHNNKLSESHHDQKQQQQQLHIGLLIGPSGGWSRREVQAMDQYETQHPHLVLSFTLGSTILRSETAAMAAVVVASAVQPPPPPPSTTDLMVPSSETSLVEEKTTI